jgi:hypothetical protein
MSNKSGECRLTERKTHIAARQSPGRDFCSLRTYASFDAAYDALEKMREFGEPADGALSLPLRSTARQPGRSPER